MRQVTEPCAIRDFGARGPVVQCLLSDSDSDSVPNAVQRRMLTIRNPQLAALHRQQALQGFVVDLIDHLRRHQGPEVAALDDGELGRHIEACVLRAGAYGLGSRRDCARFASLAACLGWSFDTERPWVAEQLADPALGPSERLGRVYDRCVRELETAALAAPRKRRYGI